MNPRVQKVKCKDSSHLIITFKNGEQKLFNMSPYFDYPVFNDLKDASLFNKAYVMNGTVAWNDEIDFDPDTLYTDGVLLENNRF